MLRIIFSTLIFACWMTVVSTESLVQSNIIKRMPSFRTPKNIAFLTQGGGTSHHLWVFEIMEELYKRGHNVSFYSTGDQTSLSKGYTMIKTYELGGAKSFLAKLSEGEDMQHKKQHIFTGHLLKYSMRDYKTAFSGIQKLYQKEKPDVVICDSFYLACADAAMILRIPVVMTSTFLLYPDAMQPFIYSKISVTDSPSSKEDSIFKRMFKKIYVPYYIWKNTRSLKDVFAFQDELGLKPAISASADRYKRIKKLVNNVYGLEPSRETSQLIHLIGPIMKKQYPTLDSSTALFMKQRTSVVYVAFGQFALASKQDVGMILPNLLRLKLEGVIDGIIWSRFNYDILPETIEVPFNGSLVAITQQELKNDPSFYAMKWAPQYAILQHSSTKLFLSHGGCSSLHESLYSGTPIFSYPFFGDQPINSRMIKRLEVGDYMDAAYLSFDIDDHQTLYSKLLQLLIDRNGKIADYMKRFSNYLQIHADSGVTRGADLVEESLFSSNSQGYLTHRQDLKHEISWIKRNDFDIYAALVAFCVLGCLLINQIIKFSYSPVLKIKVN